MRDATEYTKANMASASVLLGLTPWMLSTLGSTTMELSLLSSKRPLLALLVVLGSPALNTTRMLEYPNPFVGLVHRREIPRQQVSTKRNFAYVILELIYVLGCVAKVGTLCWTLAENAITTISCDISDMVLALWVALAVVTHVLGILTFFSRARLQTTATTRRRRIRRIFEWMKNRLALVEEFIHSANQSDLPLEWGSQNRNFKLWSSCAAIYTVGHILFGSLVLFSLSFVGMFNIYGL